MFDFDLPESEYWECDDCYLQYRISSNSFRVFTDLAFKSSLLVSEIAARPTSVYKYLLEHLGSRVNVLGMRRLVHAVQSELELFQRGNRSGVQELTAYIWEIAARPLSMYTYLLELRGSEMR